MMSICAIFEGRSALLLGKAKDNNASCSLGPLVRLFDESFTVDDVRTAAVTLRVDGPADTLCARRRVPTWPRSAAIHSNW